MNNAIIRRRQLMQMSKTESAEGSQIVFNTNTQRGFAGLQLYGASNQIQTTGAQLIPFDVGKEIVSNNRRCSIYCDENGFLYSISAKATVASDSDVYFLGNADSSNEYGYKTYDLFKPGKQYKVECNIRDTTVYVVAWRNNRSNILADTRKNVFTAEEGDKYRVFIRPTNAGTNIREETGTAIIKELDSSVEWEIYTGGKPSPSPEYPQSWSNKGDGGRINVTVEGTDEQQTMIVSTPNGLTGVPIKKNGDYTDSNGQSWISDYIDFQRFEYVQKTKVFTLDNIKWQYREGDNKDQSRKDATFIFSNFNVSNTGTICTHFSTIYSGYGTTSLKVDKSLLIPYGFVDDGEYHPENLQPFINFINTLEGFKIQCCYTTENTIVRTPLSDEQIQAYQALYAYSPTTTISNDSDAWMKVQYKVRR